MGNSPRTCMWTPCEHLFRMTNHLQFSLQFQAGSNGWTKNVYKQKRTTRKVVKVATYARSTKTADTRRLCVCLHGSARMTTAGVDNRRGGKCRNKCVAKQRRKASGVSVLAFVSVLPCVYRFALTSLRSVAITGNHNKSSGSPWPRNKALGKAIGQTLVSLNVYGMWTADRFSELVTVTAVVSEWRAWAKTNGRLADVTNSDTAGQHDVG